MKSSSKISILVSIQIILILGSFLVLAYFESEKTLHGNLVNISGKNRVLTSEIKNEINHIVFHVQTDRKFTAIIILESNLLFLKDGGTKQGIELRSLDGKYSQDWDILWSNFLKLESALNKLQIEDDIPIPINNVEEIERLSDNLIIDFDSLTNKIGNDLKVLSVNILIFEILLGSVNIVVHVFMILYIISIFKKESKEKIKNERFVSIGEFASSIAHDIKNPLTIIANSLQIIDTIPSSSLKPEVRDDLIKKEISHMRASIKRIDHQVEDVLNYVKNVPMKVNENSLLEILEGSKDTVIIPSHIQIELPTNDAKIECDEDQIHVVFVNLFRNAIQAIGSDSGSITVEISEVQSNKVKIDFANSGPPIPNGEISNLFEPLFTSKMEGTGLGLTSCKNIITRHNGSIDIQSDPVIFTIILPKRHRFDR